MKQILLLFCMICSVGLMAQDAPTTDLSTAETGKIKSMLGKFSVTATAGTNAFGTSELKNLSADKLTQVSLGELSINYKMNSRFSFGIASMSNLSNGNSGYYNKEGAFVSFCDDDDDDDDELDEIEDPFDDDDDEFDDDDDEGCDDDDIFGQNLMGSVTVKLSEKLPFFVQAAGGYSLSGNAPAYSAMIGYNQKVFAGIGIIAGVRYSDVLYNKPADAVKVTNSAGLKAELGLSWNF